MKTHFLSLELTSPYMSLSFCMRAACSADGCLGRGGLSSRRWENEEDEDEVDARGGDLSGDITNQCVGNIASRVSDQCQFCNTRNAEIVETQRRTRTLETLTHRYCSCTIHISNRMINFST